MKRLGLFLLFLACLVPQAAAAKSRMAVTLVAEQARVAPGGPVTLAFVMRPERGWHGYWSNPGDAGAAPRVAWRLPPGWQAGPLEYPVPERMTLLGLANYVYEGEHALLATVRVPAGGGGRVPIRARLDYLVCTDEICVPETADVATQVEVSAAGAPAPAFAAWRAALPRPLAEAARFELRGPRLRIGIPLPASAGIDSPYFFAAGADLVRHSAEQRAWRGANWLVIETEAGPAAARASRLDGVLKIGPGVGLALAARPGPVPAGGVPLGAQSAADGASTILLALAGALLGGLLLNLMPCVFPILSLKALSLARAGESESGARREALAYTGGAVLACAALGGALLAFRAGGATVGWAFQLQQPRVIFVLLMLVTAIAANLAGLFELPALGRSARREPAAGGAFLTGALAAFVATPCTGPFLGFALGAALVLPGWAALAVFAGLGLGLALPFLLIGFVPALRRRLPRPGPWMARFRHILAVPMLATAAGLAWILARQAGTQGLALGLAAAIALGLMLWWIGRRQPAAAPLWALVLAAIALVAPLPFLYSLPPASATPGVLAAERFSETRLARLRAEGRPVFVYFTADWCLTCKVNEQAVLGRAEVTRAFARRGVRVLAGDWTRGDPEIGRFLERHGRSGVPLYLYYAPGRDAEILPQFLTVGRLTRL